MCVWVSGWENARCVDGCNMECAIAHELVSTLNLSALAKVEKSEAFVCLSSTGLEPAALRLEV